jgi:hypothetical protein
MSEVGMLPTVTRHQSRFKRSYMSRNRHLIGTFAITALLMFSAPSAKAADADCSWTWDHGLVCTITILGKTITVTTYAKASDEQKQRVLRTVEAWKNLPDNQQSLDYVAKEARKIKREIKDISITRKMDTASPSLATKSKGQSISDKSKAGLEGTRLSPATKSLTGSRSSVLDTRPNALKKPDVSLKR